MSLVAENYYYCVNLHNFLTLRTDCLPILFRHVDLFEATQKNIAHINIWDHGKLEDYQQIQRLALATVKSLQDYELTLMGQKIVPGIDDLYILEILLTSHFLFKNLCNKVKPKNIIVDDTIDSEFVRSEPKFVENASYVLSVHVLGKLCDEHGVNLIKAAR